ncbi:penicillin acylase family protein [Euzebya rosea]|uniref:penicillin acylase family protein n=1 Tax=Euzebya rosea TaxID=2052804 RepID=UPI000D3E7EF0|nr:penicillin acylase family protein [Euzebya rosea]
MQSRSVHASLFLVATLVAALLAPIVPSARAQDAPVDIPPQGVTAVSLMPPGNSGFTSVTDQVAGSAGGSFGEHTDDQTSIYWGLEGYAGQGFLDPADAVRTETLRDGAVRVYWDEFGTPAIHGDTAEDVWFGTGWAVAQIRLFLMDAVRRQGRGTFAELVGTSGVPLDVQTRTLTYSDEEYQAIINGLSDEALTAVQGYVDGANEWIAEVNANPDLLPVEYALLSTRPEPLDLIDIAAAGVLITRSVAAEGGNEMDNVRLLRDLEAEHGEEEGRAIFADLVWQDDPLAVTTVPREEGTFPNSPLTDLDASLDAAADFAATLPLELADGPGTGAYPEPSTLPAFADDTGSRSGASDQADAVDRARAFRAADALAEWAASLHGGSIGMAIGPSRTADDNAMLISGPQLGWTYPSLLVEYEVHGGGYDARGASVPALPVVGIGYTDRVAWALTTGYSKTVDSFIETVRDNPTDGGPLQYRHDGQWKDADCRTETIDYRESTQGLPVTPALRSVDVEVCRTVHGPIVAQEDGDGERLARSVQYQMFGQEVDTIDGVLAWNRAESLEDFEAAMRQVTWNENTTYADADGHIAFWHPGIHHERPANDLRFPLPGDGSADFGDRIPFDDLPHAIDPAQGFLVNWNNKPAHDWLDGEGIGPTSRPGGAVQRVATPIALAESRTDHTFETLQAIEMESALTDPRAEPFLPLVLSAIDGVDARLDAVADLLAGWNTRFYDPPNAPTTFRGPGGQSSLEDGTDGPAATIFSAVVDALVVEVLGSVWGGPIADADAAAACNSGRGCPDLVSRQLGVGGHRYDMSPALNLVLRALDPASSGLAVRHDWLGDRTAEEVLVAAVESALATLEDRFGADDLSAFRRTTFTTEVNSLTGVTGPSSVQPYLERGSYVHLATFDGLPALTTERAGGPERVATSVAAALAAHPDGSDTVVLADAGTYHDALLASPLAGFLDAPIVLVDGTLSTVAREGIAQLGATDAVIVGSLVGPEVAAELESMGLSVRRVGDGDPYAVGAAVAAELPGSVLDDGAPEAYVVTADGFADAVSITGVAARTHRPILFVTRDEIPRATADTIEALGIERVAVVGGTAVIADAVMERLPSPTRLAGPERYTTAEAVLNHARAIGLSFDTLVLATGANFPDSLTGGPVAAALDGVVVLVNGLDPAAPGAALGHALSQRASVKRVIGLGGTAVISDAFLAAVPTAS